MMNCPDCITEEQHRNGIYGKTVRVHTVCVSCALEMNKPLNNLPLSNDPARFYEWEAMYRAGLVEQTNEGRV